MILLPRQSSSSRLRGIWWAVPYRTQNLCGVRIELHSRARIARAHQLGDVANRVKVISGRFTGHLGTVDYPDDSANGYHVILDTEELLAVRQDLVAARR